MDPRHKGEDDVREEHRVKANGGAGACTCLILSSSKDKGRFLGPDNHGTKQDVLQQPFVA